MKEMMRPEQWVKKRGTLALRILRYCRNELYSRYPSLDVAFAGLRTEETRDVELLGTDGERIFYHPETLPAAFAGSGHRKADGQKEALQCMSDGQKEALHYMSDQDRRCFLVRGYLHLLLHCLFLHILRPSGSDPGLWDLACDMAAEALLDRESRKNPTLSWQPFPGETEERAQYLAQIRKTCYTKIPSGMLSAEQHYGMLQRESFPYTAEELRAAFRFDDHSFWKGERMAGASGLRSRWELLRAHAGGSRGGVFGMAGSSGGSEMEKVAVPALCSRYDYRSFLQSFMEPREEVELDTESFDYIYYSFGMEHYGNLPLIEPLEYREVNRLAALAIAIDTSGSCKAEVVAQFLAETKAILEEKETFFSRMQVCLIQCDCWIQDVQLIHSMEEWEEKSRNIRIHGRGGTDFQPVFRYLDEQRHKGEFRDLKALIYFTDGDGVYPEHAPEYETAFVFVERTPGMEKVPKWAHRFLAS